MASRISPRALALLAGARQSSLLGGIRAASSHAHNANSAPLSPSVASLLQQHNISSSDIPKIPATGPKGRLLKGDVLSYVGAIAQDYPSTLSSQISQLAHLDLSNIKVAAPAPPPPPPSSQQQQPELEPYTAPIVETVKVSVPVSLSNLYALRQRVQKRIGVSLPLPTLVGRAAHLANIDLPISREAYVSADPRRKIESLYEDILASGPPAREMTTMGSYWPELETVADGLDQEATQTHTTKDDIIDILSGKSRGKPAAVPRIDDDLPEDSPVFSVTVPPAEKSRAQEFLRRVRNYVEDRPDSLLLI